jgi:tetratricopeptide (TPR) repeat protein
MLHKKKKLIICLLTALSTGFLTSPNVYGETSVVEDIRQSYQIAEQAMNQYDYVTARTAYLEIIGLGIREIAGKNTYVDIVTRLSAAEALLGDYDSAETRLLTILKEELPDTLLVKVETFRAQLYTKQNKHKNAYEILKNLDMLVSMTTWPPEERSFFVGIEYFLNRKCSDLLNNAERLTKAALYIEAIPLYIEVLDAIEHKGYPAFEGEMEKNKITLRLAESYFHGESYDKAIETLEPLIPTITTASAEEITNVEENIVYLLGRTYQKTGQKDLLLEAFTTYLSLNEDHNLSFSTEVHWELGVAHFERKDYEQSTPHFKELIHETKNMTLYYLGRLYLARTHLNKREYDSVEQILFPLIGMIPDEDPLKYELAFLRGESFYQKKIYTKAAALFEEALPHRNKAKAYWYPKTLYNIAWSNLKLSEEARANGQPFDIFLNNAEKYFQELISLNDDENAYLGLAKVYLQRGHYNENKKDLHHVETLLSSQDSFSSLHAEAEALLMRGEVATSYAEREKIYSRLTKERHSGTSPYGIGWYFRGINHFKEGQNLVTLPEKATEASFLFDEALTCLKHAFALLKDVDKQKAGLALKYSAQASFYKNTKDSRIDAIKFLSALVDSYKGLFSAMKSPDELLYLRAIIATRLYYEDDLQEYGEQIENSLTTVIEKYPGGDFVDTALNLLGTFYFRQARYEDSEHTFSKLATLFPASKHAGDAWFWAGESAEWQKKSYDIIQVYRRHVFEKYSTSVHASEAYFNYYSFSNYLQGNAEALAHLQGMELLYPRSPYLILAHYLIGMSNKLDRKTEDGMVWKKADTEAAIHAFEETKNTFDTCYEKNLINAQDLEYFVTVRYKALLERALIKLRLAEDTEGAKQNIYTEWAIEAFEDITKDFQNPSHALTTILMRGNTYPRIYEESEYGLSQAFITAKNHDAAEQHLSEMLQRYDSANIKRGYYLSRTWYHQGAIAMSKGEYELALKFLRRAEDSAKGKILSTDQYLDLLIQQSRCYTYLNNLENAMRLLSDVINYSVVSPLRLKAMYLRAEIYELQNRHELAVKQLEATANTGGEWAQKAKEKLEQEYGFN